MLDLSSLNSPEAYPDVVYPEALLVTHGKHLPLDESIGRHRCCDADCASARKELGWEKKTASPHGGGGEALWLKTSHVHLVP